MKILWYTIAVGLVVLTGYIIALLLTVSNFIDNILYMTGIDVKKIDLTSADTAIFVLTFSLTVIVILLILHLARSIKKRGGV